MKGDNKMAVSLVKGQKVSLTKEAPNLKRMVVGLGWDVNVKRGLFGTISGSFDLDASVIVLRNGRFEKSDDLVYYGNLKGCNGAIKHCGDNLTGEGDGDDEQIIINLESLPSDVDKIIVAVNIFGGKSKKQDFGCVKNAYVRICNEVNGSEIIRFNLTENYSGALSMIFGEIYKHDNDWKFNPVGEGLREDSIKRIANSYK